MSHKKGTISIQNTSSNFIQCSGANLLLVSGRVSLKPTLGDSIEWFAGGCWLLTNSLSPFFFTELVFGDSTKSYYYWNNTLVTIGSQQLSTKILLMEEILHHLRSVNIPLFTGFYTSQVVFSPDFWTINSRYRSSMDLSLLAEWCDRSAPDGSYK